MEAVIPILIVAIIFVVLNVFKINAKDDQLGSQKAERRNADIPSKKAEVIVDDESKDVSVPSIDLVFEDLIKMGCQPKRVEEQSVEASFQGEFFRFIPNKAFVRIWDPAWVYQDLDAPDVPLLKEAVNLANTEFGPTSLYTIDKEAGRIILHSRIDILYIYDIPNRADYLTAVLNSFFNIKDVVKENYQNLKGRKDIKSSGKTHPIGFASYSQNKKGHNDEQ
jgi:hypothetical protein